MVARMRVWLDDGAVIRAWREDHGLSKSDLARELKRSESTVMRWERGDYEMRVSDLRRMEALRPGFVRRFLSTSDEAHAAIRARLAADRGILKAQQASKRAWLASLPSCAHQDGDALCNRPATRVGWRCDAHAPEGAEAVPHAADMSAAARALLQLEWQDVALLAQAAQDGDPLAKDELPHYVSRLHGMLSGELPPW